MTVIENVPLCSDEEWPGKYHGNPGTSKPADPPYSPGAAHLPKQSPWGSYTANQQTTPHRIPCTLFPQGEVEYSTEVSYLFNFAVVFNSYVFLLSNFASSVIFSYYIWVLSLWLNTYNYITIQNVDKDTVQYNHKYYFLTVQIVAESLVTVL